MIMIVRRKTCVPDSDIVLGTDGSEVSQATEHPGGRERASLLGRLEDGRGHLAVAALRLLGRQLRTGFFRGGNGRLEAVTKTL